MINVQRIIKDMKKLAGEASTTVIEMKGSILAASINNQTTNTMNMVGISEDLQYLCYELKILELVKEKNLVQNLHERTQQKALY